MKTSKSSMKRPHTGGRTPLSPSGQRALGRRVKLAPEVLERVISDAADRGENVSEWIREAVLLRLECGPEMQRLLQERRVATGTTQALGCSIADTTVLGPERRVDP